MGVPWLFRKIVNCQKVYHTINVTDFGIFTIFRQGSIRTTLFHPFDPTKSAMINGVPAEITMTLHFNDQGWARG